MESALHIDDQSPEPHGCASHCLNVPNTDSVCCTKGGIFGASLGRVMRATGQISTDRSNRDQAIARLQEATKKIAEGRTVLVFPEGTRSYGGSIQSLKKGEFMLAIDAQVPIIPVGVGGIHAVVPPGN